DTQNVFRLSGLAHTEVTDLAKAPDAINWVALQMDALRRSNLPRWDGFWVLPGNGTHSGQKIEVGMDVYALGDRVIWDTTVINLYGFKVERDTAGKFMVEWDTSGNLVVHCVTLDNKHKFTLNGYGRLEGTATYEYLSGGTVDGPVTLEKK